MYVYKNNYDLAIDAYSMVKRFKVTERERILSSYARVMDAGDRRVEVQDYHSAEKLYSMAVILFPEFGDGYYRFALLYRDLGEYEDAVRFLLKGIEADPQHSAKGYWLMGELYWIQLGQEQRAFELLKKAMEFDNVQSSLDPWQRVYGYVHLAQLGYYLNLEDSAIIFGKKAIALDPHNQTGALFDAYRWLGETYCRRGQYEEGLIYLEMRFQISDGKVSDSANVSMQEECQNAGKQGNEK